MLCVYSYHSLAVAHAFLGAYRVSVDNEKRCKQLLAASLTPKHPRVQQSQVWLDHFTSLAVKAASAAANPTTAAASAAALSALSMVPPALGLSSPFAWLSFDRRMKGRLGLDDVLALVEVSARGEERRREEVSRAAEAEVEGAAAAAGEEGRAEDGEAEEEAGEEEDGEQHVNGGTTATELRKAAAVPVPVGGKTRKDKRKKAAKAKKAAAAAQ